MAGTLNSICPGVNHWSYWGLGPLGLECLPPCPEWWCSRVMKSRDLVARLLVQSPALPFTSGVILGKLLSLSLPSSSSIKSGLKTPTKFK